MSRSPSGRSQLPSAGCESNERRSRLHADVHEAMGRKKYRGQMSISNSRCLLFASLAWVALVVCADAATAQLPNCDCYFNDDCPASAPICQLSLTGGGPVSSTDPDRACEWMTPKPTEGPGTGCDQPYTGSGGPCDGVCVNAPAPPITQQWDHWDAGPGAGSSSSGCFPGGPYSYFIKFVVENEACDLPSHCSLCETEVFIPSGTTAVGTAALVGSTLTEDCSAAGFTFDVFGRRIYAEILGQIFDVCVNGVKVASAVSPPGLAQICQDGSNPTTYQVAGDILMVPGLSPEGFAILISLMLVGSVVILVCRTRPSIS
jgi:hypothetical protein